MPHLDSKAVNLSFRERAEAELNVSTFRVGVLLKLNDETFNALQVMFVVVIVDVLR